MMQLELIMKLNFMIQREDLLMTRPIHLHLKNVGITYSRCRFETCVLFLNEKIRYGFDSVEAPDFYYALKI